MKPGFTLNLSHDGIGLLHRAGPGWFTVGEVSLDDADLAGALARLRRTALELEPKGLTSKLIIPDTQILYSEIEAPGPDAAARRAQIAVALEGRTPYPVEDLVFDWSGHGDVVQVAVVARDTLAEAEEFAETYGFCPVAFVASPAPGKFGGEPFFGLTSRAAQHLPEGARLDRDQDPVRPGGVIRAPIATATADTLAEAPAEPVAEIEAEAPPAPEMTAPPEPTPAVMAEPEPAPEVEPEPEAPAKPAPEPETTAPEPEPEIPADPEGSEAPEPLAEAAAEPAPEAGPVPAPETLEALPLEALPAEVATDTAAPSPSPAPEMTDAEAPPAEADAPQAHESQAASLDAPQAVAEAEADAPLPGAEAVTETPFVAVNEPEADAPASDAVIDTPADTATSTPAAEDTPESDKAARAEDLPLTEPETPADPKGAALGHTAAKIPPLPPLGTAGAWRLGGAGARDSLPPLPQGKRLSVDGSATDASVVAPGLALPKEDPPQPAKPARRGGVKKAKAEARARFVSAARSTAALGGAAGKALARGIANRKKAKPETPAAPVTGKALATAGTTDPDRTVFGSRKLQPVGGKPKFLGLALTLGLLIFMGGVVLWSNSLDSDAPEPQQTASTGQLPPEPAPLPAATTPEPDSAQTDPAQPAPETQTADTVPDEAPASVVAEPPAEAEPDPAELAMPSVEAPDVWGELASGNAPGAPQLGLSAVSSSVDPGRPTASETTLPPVESLVTDAVPAPLPLPAPFEQLARINPDGEIEPTPQGVAMPGGFTLYSGQPDLVPAPRPEAVTAAAIAAGLQPATEPPPAAEETPAAQDAPATEEAPYADPALAGFRPAARPAAIVPAIPAPEEAAPDTGALPAEDDGAALVPAPSSAEEQRLAAIKPRARPQAVAIANTRLAEQRAAEEAAAEASRAAMESATKLAVAVSRRPPSKPRDFSNAVAAAVAAAVAETTIRVSAPAPEPAPRAAPKQAAAAAAPTPEPEEIDEPEPVAVAPKVPTSASVAKQATQKNVLNLGKMNLIGLYGSSNKRRALVRMPNGRFVKVSVGDRLDGGRVTGIGNSELTYQKGGRNIVLKLLKGS